MKRRRLLRSARNDDEKARNDDERARNDIKNEGAELFSFALLV